MRSASNLYYSKVLSSIYLPSVADDILAEIIQILSENSKIDDVINIGLDFKKSSEDIFLKILDDFSDELKKYSPEMILTIKKFLLED